MIREEVIYELRQMELDLAALKKSRDVLLSRLREQEGIARYDETYRWPLMQVLLNTYLAAITRCEGLIEDYRTLLESMEEPNNVIQLEVKP